MVGGDDAKVGQKEERSLVGDKIADKLPCSDAIPGKCRAPVMATAIALGVYVI
jgi:hypothetical protein